ncbi:hypothetical protein DPEC_G00088920 [Dallia pectoralis]|uniref:Uncharacterized protein n=1 Tax=Dallia pectoralis TaxID=75939 RepID=A0ACC2H1K7_DALPE|nr:hypothetical protein DPEC_G00088920 [Dallia pectoralis]
MPSDGSLFADDSSIVGCITEDNYEEYSGLVQSFGRWSEANYLLLNTSKTKELVVDFRRNKKPLTPITIQGNEVEVVEVYKYLGVHINDKLGWADNTEAHYKKGQCRLFFLRRLRKEGDRVLVKNVNIRGKHKLADKWERPIHIVVKRIDGGPVAAPSKPTQLRLRSRQNQEVECEYSDREEEDDGYYVNEPPQFTTWGPYVQEFEVIPVSGSESSLNPRAPEFKCPEPQLIHDHSAATVPLGGRHGR